MFFSTSNNRQQNRRRKPWSQLLHCKMTRDSSTPWETLWQRSGAYDGYVAISWQKYNWVCVLSLVQLYANHGTVKHTKCDWRFGNVNEVEFLFPGTPKSFCSRLLDCRGRILKFAEQLGLILRMWALIVHLNSLRWHWCCEFGSLEFLTLGVVFPSCLISRGFSFLEPWGTPRWHIPS